MLITWIFVSFFALTSCQTTDKPEYYPASWHQVDVKAIIDNDRLYFKYKACALSNNTAGCPRIVDEMKKVAPEVVDTMCAKCTPEHIEAGREAINYTCLTRRSEYDYYKARFDPDGELLRRAEAKFGKLTCE